MFNNLSLFSAKIRVCVTESWQKFSHMTWIQCFCLLYCDTPLFYLFYYKSEKLRNVFLDWTLLCITNGY